MGRSRSAEQRAEYWDKVYRRRGIAGVSWFQPVATVSIALMDRLGVSKDAAVVDIGAGASPLLDELANRGFRDLSALDVSEAALTALRERLGPEIPVTYINEDLLAWSPARHFDLWHDRAVFHFLVNSIDKAQYRKALEGSLAPGGAIILATFALDGPEMCSGLPVNRYSPTELKEFLGRGFHVVEEAREVHVTPSGAMQPFSWLAARRPNRDR